MSNDDLSDVPGEATERLGTLLKDKYRLDSVLGVGGMAFVYAATHRNRKRFAVKILRAELSIRTEIRGRFVREGYIANTVGHPGAVAVLDDDVASDGAAFLVMELLEGAGLEQVWERHGCRIPLRGALAVGWQLLDVLAAAHEKEIVHRDIKPANLFVTRDGTLKVLDFGIARLRDAASEHATQSGTAMGTPAFMPPEQVLGKASQIDALTDIWAVGATLFTLLSSHLVHEGETPQELMVKSATVRPRSLADVSRDLPPAVVGVIDRALEFDRAKRWPSAVAMRDAIAECYRATFSENISAAPVAALLVAARDGAAAPALIGDTPPAATGDPPKARRSVPVAPTLDATKIAPSVDATAVDRTVAVPPIAQLIGMTTSHPVSNETPPQLPGTSSQRPAAAGRRRFGVIAAAVVAAAVVLVALGTRLTTVSTGRGGATAQPSGAAEPPSTAAASSVAGVTAATPPPGPVATAPASSTKIAPADAAPVEARPPATRDPRLGTAPRAGATSVRGGAPSGAPPTASPAPAAPPAAPAPSVAAKPSCDPPYTIDSAGRRVLKRECL